MFSVRNRRKSRHEEVKLLQKLFVSLCRLLSCTVRILLPVAEKGALVVGWDPKGFHTVPEQREPMPWRSGRSKVHQKGSIRDECESLSVK